LLISASYIKDLARATLGEIPLTLVIEGGEVLDVFTGEIIRADVGVFRDRVVAVGDSSRFKISASTTVLKASGRYIVPGLMDAHMHVESTLLIPPRLAEILIPHGVTSLFIDPHEVANVSGVEGINALLKMTEGVPLRFFIEVPSRVPTAPGLETSGGYLGPEEVREYLRREEAVSLGELNYQNLLSLKDEYLEKVASALNLGKVVNGHLPGLTGRLLDASLAAGVMDDHESISFEEALEKARKGCSVMVREGTSERNLEDIVSGIVSSGLSDLRSFMFCTDDKHPEDIVNEGHIDYSVRKSIELGLDPVKAYQMATINIAEHFRLDHLLGAVAPHRKADILIIKDLRRVGVEAVVFDGIPVLLNGELLYTPPEKIEIPEPVKDSVRVGDRLRPEDLVIRVSPSAKEALVRVMGVIPGQILVKELIEWVKASEGILASDPSRDLLHIAVVERHEASGRVGKAFVKGFGIKEGAIASSVAHDHHNIVVVGTNAKDMYVAVRHLEAIGGGFTAVMHGEPIASLQLEFAGLMSTKPAGEVIGGLRKLNALVRDVMGSTLKSPFMQLEFITLPTVPELGLTDKGLIDSRKYRLISPVIEVR
jgi:adenine deaminase